MRAAAPRLATASLAWAAALGACYEPQFELCAVRCAHDAPCPDGMFCGPDLNCHASEDEETCPPSTFTVTVHRVGSGSVGGYVTTEDAGQLDCGGACTFTILEGTRVTLLADSDETARFNAWNGVDECGLQDRCSVIVNDDLDIDAEFIRQFPVGIVFRGAGSGRVTSTPAGLECTTDTFDCVGWFDVGTPVTLTAFPDRSFAGWTGVGCGGDRSCSFTVDGPIELDAAFE